MFFPGTGTWREFADDRSTFGEDPMCESDIRARIQRGIIYARAKDGDARPADIQRRAMCDRVDPKSETGDDDRTRNAKVASELFGDIGAISRTCASSDDGKMKTRGVRKHATDEQRERRIGDLFKDRRICGVSL
jgi:predicted Rdx family selenoprotein